MSQLVLVDDSSTIQKIVELAFAAEDFDVHSFNDSGDALDHLVLQGADVVLADITLAGVDGYELCRRIRLSPKLAEVPVVLLAGTFEPFDVQKAEQAGYSGSLTKPFEASQLINLVRDLVAEPAVENGGGRLDRAILAAPVLFEVPVGPVQEPMFELRADQCGAAAEPLSRRRRAGSQRPDAEVEQVARKVLARAATELQRRIPGIVRQVLREKK